MSSAIALPHYRKSQHCCGKSVATSSPCCWCDGFGALQILFSFLLRCPSLFSWKYRAEFGELFASGDVPTAVELKLHQCIVYLATSLWMIVHIVGATRRRRQYGAVQPREVSVLVQRSPVTMYPVDLHMWIRCAGLDLGSVLCGSGSLQLLHRLQTGIFLSSRPVARLAAGPPRGKWFEGVTFQCPRSQTQLRSLQWALPWTELNGAYDQRIGVTTAISQILSVNVIRGSSSLF